MTKSNSSGSEIISGCNIPLWHRLESRVLPPVTKWWYAFTNLWHHQIFCPWFHASQLCPKTRLSFSPMFVNLVRHQICPLEVCLVTAWVVTFVLPFRLVWSTSQPRLSERFRGPRQHHLPGGNWEYCYMEVAALSAKDTHSQVFSGAAFSTAGVGWDSCMSTPGAGMGTWVRGRLFLPCFSTSWLIRLCRRS